MSEKEETKSLEFSRITSGPRRGGRRGGKDSRNSLILQEFMVC